MSPQHKREVEVLAADPVLASLIDRFGILRLQPADDPFRRLVVSIINQQLSTASATAIRQRLFERFSVTPGDLLQADPGALREAGLSRQKAAYLKAAAAAFVEKDLDRSTLAALADAEVIGRLTSIRGIGIWTAKMFLIFALARPDVFPVEDLGIRRSIEQLYGDLSRDEMTELAGAWRPYRSIASLYLWKAYD